MQENHVRDEFKSVWDSIRQLKDDLNKFAIKLEHTSTSVEALDKKIDRMVVISTTILVIVTASLIIRLILELH